MARGAPPMRGGRPGKAPPAFGGRGNRAPPFGRGGKPPTPPPRGRGTAAERAEERGERGNKRR